MKDRMEEFIKDNRQQFDLREPSDQVWKNIRFRMGLAGQNTGIWWKVAAIAFFTLSVMLFINRGSSIPVENRQLAGNFTEVEDFYLHQISQKQDLLSDLSQNTILGEQAERDLQNLDAMYEVLKEEYTSNPSKQVVDALILNLLLKIDILNDELEKAEHQESEEKEISV